ncbi:MAG: hypothetical protein V1929_12360 [bacterium]
MSSARKIDSATQVSAKVSACLVLFISSTLCGCSTIKNTRQVVEKIDGQPIAGTERRFVDVVKMTNVWDSEKPEFQRLTVTAKGSKEWQVEQFEETWVVQDKERSYAVVGRGEGYNLGYDLFADPVFACVGLLVYPFAFLAPRTDNPDASFGNINRTVSQWLFAALPGISNCAKPIRTSSRSLKSRDELPPAGRATSVDAWIELLVYDGGNVRVMEQALDADKPLLLPVCDFALNSPGHPEVTFVVTSKTAMVRGPNRLTIRLNETELVRRKAAAQKANPDERRQAYAFHPGHDLDDHEGGNGDGLLRAGETVLLVMTVDNSGSGPGYGVELAASVKGGDVSVGSPQPVTQLKGKSSARIGVPLTVPLKSPDGVARIEVVAADAAGVTSSPVAVEIPYSHRPLPELQLGSVDVQRAPDGADGDFGVIIKVRNRGDGDSERTKLAIAGEPSAGRVVRGQIEFGTLAPHSQTQAVLRLNSTGATSDVTTIQVRIVERLGVGSDEKSLDIPIPASGKRTSRK